MFEYLFNVSFSFEDLVGVTQRRELQFQAENLSTADFIANMYIRHNIPHAKNLKLTIKPAKVSESDETVVLDRLLNLQVSWDKFVENLGTVTPEETFYKLYLECKGSNYSFDAGWNSCVVQFGDAFFTVKANFSNLIVNWDLVRLGNYIIDETEVYKRDVQYV